MSSSSNGKNGNHGHNGAHGTNGDDARDALDLSAGENADLCAGCTQCCTYITVEIDSPRAAWEYDQWIWALHHERVGLFVEWPERWFLHFETRCERLNAAGRCSIHGRHPVLCRSYDPRTCERRLPLGEVTEFHDADQLEAWLRVRRPKHWERLMAYRKDQAPAEPATAGFVSIGELMGAGTRSRGRRTVKT